MKRVLLVSALACAALDDGARAQPAEDPSAPIALRATLQSGVEAKVELAGGNGWQEEIVYEVYFSTDASDLIIEVPRADGRVDSLTVYRVSPRDRRTELRVQKCRLIDGVPRCVDIEGIAERVPRSGKLVELTLPPVRVDWSQDFFRASMGEGRYTLTPTDAAGNARPDGARASDAVKARTLPTLADLERQYVQQRPFLRLSFSPFVRDHAEGGSSFDELSATFDGGIYRSNSDGNRVWHVTWDGDVATRKPLAFDRMALEGGLGINLRRRDWLPVTLAMSLEADRDLNALDVSGLARLRYILPFNLNVQSGPYRPALAPRLQVVAAAGHAAHRDSELGSEEPFFRSGYDVRWRVPMALSSALRLHQAGTWNAMAGAEPRWHVLWDLLFETELGGVTYYVGYQKGEAAPLFQPTETTRIGFTLATAGIRRK